MSGASGETHDHWGGVARRLIVLGGGEPNALLPGERERGYFVGLGWAIVFAATIAGGSVGSAAVIAYGADWWVGVLVGAAWFVLIAGLDRFLVVDPTAGFRVGSPGGLVSTSFRWLVHFCVETLKVLPRAVMIIVSSLLFAEIAIVGMARHEIDDQLQLMDQERMAQYEGDVQVAIGVAKAAATQERTTLVERISAAVQLDVERLAARKPLADRLTQLEDEDKKYWRNCDEADPQCHWPKSSIYTRAEAELKTFDTQHPSNEKDIAADRVKVLILDARLGDEATALKISAQLNLSPPIATIESEVRSAQSTQKPSALSGFFARRRALSRLLDDGAFSCPEPAAGVVSTCVDPYDKGVRNTYVLVRWFLLLGEVSAIAMKWIRSLLPRGGFGNRVYVRDERLRIDQEGRLAEALSRQSTRLARLTAEERVERELIATERELELRAISEHRLRRQLVKIGQRVDKADTAPRGGKGEGATSTVVRGDGHLY